MLPVRSCSPALAHGVRLALVGWQNAIIIYPAAAEAATAAVAATFRRLRWPTAAAAGGTPVDRTKRGKFN